MGGVGMWVEGVGGYMCGCGCVGAVARCVLGGGGCLRTRSQELTEGRGIEEGRGTMQQSLPGKSLDFKALTSRLLFRA